jgi:imidazoleglycerol-phosphate dehydratase/histidinol-phosphatase
VFDGLRRLREAGYELVIVTNQDGIGHGSFTWEDFDEAQDFFMKKKDQHGIQFFDVFICPHFLEDGCDCRKPQIGLVRDFIWENEMEPEDSYMVGDRPTDVEFGKNLEIKSIYLVNPRFPVSSREEEQPDCAAANFTEAVDYILRKPLTDLPAIH